MSATLAPVVADLADAEIVVQAVSLEDELSVWTVVALVPDVRSVDTEQPASRAVAATAAAMARRNVWRFMGTPRWWWPGAGWLSGASLSGWATHR